MLGVIKMKKWIVTLLGLIILTQNTYAGIIDTDSNSFIDTGTGLEWMDFGINNIHSFGYVESQLSESGDYEGWRLPSSEEVYSMWTTLADLENVEARYENPDRFGTGQLYASDKNSNIAGGDDSVWESAYSAIGYNDYRSRNAHGYAYELFYSFGQFKGTDGLSYVYAYDYTDLDDGNFSTSDLLAIVDNRNYDSVKFIQRDEYSTLLVKEATSQVATNVPEPSSMVLFGLGVAGLLHRKKLSNLTKSYYQ